MEKQLLRKAGIQARDRLHPDEREEKSGTICRHMIQDTAFQEANTILFYRAVRAEVSLESAIRAARLAGKRCCFPDRM